jgi:uncharacterized protein (DUF433 family)
MDFLRSRAGGTTAKTNGPSLDLHTRIPADDRIRIVCTPGTCGGKPRIDGHRITVEDVVIWHERLGMSPDEIVTAIPGITLSDVHAALAYYFEHRDQVDADVLDGERFVARIKYTLGPGPLHEKRKQRTDDAPDDSISPR